MEFLGCYWHGCRKCHPEQIQEYNKTAERLNILEQAGYDIQTIYECDWNEQKNKINNIK